MSGKLDYIKKMAGVVKAIQQGGRAFEMTHCVTDFDLLTDPVTDQPVPVDISDVSRDKPEELQQSSLCRELTVVSPYATPAERAKMMLTPYDAFLKTLKTIADSGRISDPGGKPLEEVPALDTYRKASPEELTNYKMFQRGKHKTNFPKDSKELSEDGRIFESVAERFKGIEIKIGKGNNFKSGLTHNLEMGQALIALDKSDEPRNLQFVRTKIRTARSDVRQRFGEIVFDPSRILLYPFKRKKHYLFVALRFKIIKVSRKK